MVIVTIMATCNYNTEFHFQPDLSIVALGGLTLNP